MDGLLSPLNLLEFLRNNHREVVKKPKQQWKSQGLVIGSSPASQLFPLLLVAGHQPLSPFPLQSAILSTTSNDFPLSLHTVGAGGIINKHD